MSEPGQLLRNVSPKRWRAMCERSAALQAKAAQLRRRGAFKGAAEIWQTLTPLNQNIRRLSVLPADGSEPLT